MKHQWSVKNFMSSLHWTIGSEQPLKKAMEIMQEHQIRHLPVLQGKRLVGILTDRDMAIARSFQGAAELRVEGVMMPMTYAIPPETPLAEACEHMAQHKIGSAVIQSLDGVVIGIFTANDGLRALSEILRESYRIAI